MSKRAIPWTKHFQAIEKHLDKNEKYFRLPEKKMAEWDAEKAALEKEMDIWNKGFLNKISAFEKLIHELEKKMEK
ncbi:hypothetical protein [Virgibacillus sp. SK37]|uniref:hypothetical protein n=1 Tax=Virgibacillus sp. SK37 TaxID=403957 RepID=UPI0004D0FFC5|nr:hypothetical protein [Virgibacillus sp. SK37]AIF42792.1 hypothetical protein X953_05645 [Virgibacillus sp. SK37]